MTQDSGTLSHPTRAETMNTRHLSRITTAWSDLFRAHAEPGEAAREARRRLIERYGVPAYAYLRKALGGEAAGEVFQDVALRFVRGDFHRADPEKGRFRDYLKAVLANAIREHRRKEAGRPGPLPAGEIEAGGGRVEEPGDEAEYRRSCRAALLARAWEDLADEERSTGRPLFTVLSLRVEGAGRANADLPRRIGERLGRPVDPKWVYKWVHLARARYAGLLLEGVAESLALATREAVEAELIELDLLCYCRPAFERWRGPE